MSIAINIFVAAAQIAVGDTLRISLEDAVSRALEANPSLQAVQADARAAAELPRQASQAFLPSITLDLNAVRTNDPVAVFGLKLRQENFSAGDLDLGALNDPDPYGGWTSAAVIQQPLLVPEALFGHGAARKASQAKAAAARRASGATRFFVTRTYWDAQLAARQVEALDTAITAARAHARQAEAMHEQGLVTGLDARLARLRASELEVRRLAAQAQADNALSALRTLLALPDSASVALTDSLGDGTWSDCAAQGAQCSLESRADLEAYRLGAEAADLGVRSAWSSQLPALAAFGSLAYNGQDSPWDEGSGNWMIGVGLTWPLFHGLKGVGNVRAAKAEHSAALARQEAAERQAALEVLEAERMLEAARGGAQVAAQAAAEAEEAVTHARARYRTGAAPITELLDVEAAATVARLNLVAARRGLYVAQAALDLAYGVYDR